MTRRPISGHGYEVPGYGAPAYPAAARLTAMSSTVFRPSTPLTKCLQATASMAG